VLNAVEIAGWTLSHAPKLPALLGPRSARRFLFRCRTCCSKVWYPNVNSFSNRNRIMSAKFEPNAKCSLSSNHRTTIMNILLYNKRTMLTAPHHCDYCKWHVYCYRSIPPPTPYPHHNSHSALSKYGRSFCRTLYILHSFQEGISFFRY
jgi:hypothetical protein